MKNIFEGVKNVLFVGAHTDDEVICAGTLAKLKKAGAKVTILTFSESSTPQGGNVFEEYGQAMKLLDADGFVRNFGDDTIPQHRDEIRQIIYDYVGQHQVDLAFILSPHDDHQSHACVGEEAQRVMKNRVPAIIRCQYPWNYIALNPNLFVELSDDEFELKLNLMKIYRSQAFRYNYEEIFKSTAIADGLSVKRGPCEKFEIVRFMI